MGYDAGEKRCTLSLENSFPLVYFIHNGGILHFLKYRTLITSPSCRINEIFMGINIITVFIFCILAVK